MNPDMQKVAAFAGQVVTDIAAAFSGVMTNIGHKLGLTSFGGPIAHLGYSNRPGWFFASGGVASIRNPCGHLVRRPSITAAMLL